MYASNMYGAENVTSKIAWIVADQIYYEGIRPNVRKKILKIKSVHFSFPPNNYIPEKKIKTFLQDTKRIKGLLI